MNCLLQTHFLLHKALMDWRYVDYLWTIGMLLLAV